MLDQMRQNRFVTRWKHSAGKFFSIRLTYQTWLLLITTCLHRCVTALAEQPFDSYEDVKKSLEKWFAPKGSGIYKFTDVVFTNCSKIVENAQQMMEHTLNKAFFIILTFFKEKIIRISNLYRYIFYFRAIFFNKNH